MTLTDLGAGRCALCPDIDAIVSDRAGHERPHDPAHRFAVIHVHASPIVGACIATGPTIEAAVAHWNRAHAAQEAQP